MDVVEQLEMTLKALDEAKIPETLKSVAFGKVFDVIGGDVAGELVSPRVKGSGAPGLDRIAGRLGVSTETVESAFVLEGEKLELVIPAARFDTAKSRGTEQIALLVAAARQASGLDDDGWTSVDPIRVGCEHFKRYDSSNFAATIREMENVFSVRGTGRDRKVRMTAPAWQAASELLTHLVGA